MTLLLGSAIKLEGGEEVVRIGQADLARLEDEAVRRVEGGRRAREKEGMEEDGFAIDVVGVRLVAEKGRVRQRSHEEFLVRTTRAGMEDTHVWRRYGDFKRLSDEVRLLQLLPCPLPPRSLSLGSPFGHRLVLSLTLRDVPASFPLPRRRCALPSSQGSHHRLHRICIRNSRRRPTVYSFLPLFLPPWCHNTTSLPRRRRSSLVVRALPCPYLHDGLYHRTGSLTLTALS